MSNQNGLFDGEFRLREISEHGDPLEKLNEFIDWSIFRPILNKALIKTNKGPGGRPAFDYVMMFKILILQRLYNLSDRQMEYQIKDRLSFMRFLGLTLKDKVPDEKTLWHFRECLTKSKAINKLFYKFNNFLSIKGLKAKEGSIIDASFVDVPIQRNSREENKEIKSGKMPDSWKDKKSKLCQKDVDAKWAIKYREKHFGYKNHIKIGKDTKLIKKYVTTPANVHDSQCFETLVDENDNEIYGDSAYPGKKNELILEKYNIKSMLHEKGCRHKKLTEEQRLLNKEKSRVRVRVEHVFAVTKNVFNSRTIRTVGIKRAGALIGLINLTYNLWRYKQIMSKKR